MHSHTVLMLWIRAREGAALEPRDKLVVDAGRGIQGDHSYQRLRHVTIVFEDDWNAATAALGRPVDPVARRANVLVSGADGARFVGRTIRLGPLLVEVKGITRPCPVMDQAAAGLQEALRPDGRSGIWGRVLEGGELVPGDGLQLASAPAV